jgi:hypothetical protein
MIQSFHSLLALGERNKKVRGSLVSSIIPESAMLSLTYFPWIKGNTRGNDKIRLREERTDEAIYQTISVGGPLRCQLLIIPAKSVSTHLLPLSSPLFIFPSSLPWWERARVRGTLKVRGHYRGGNLKGIFPLVFILHASVLHPLVIPARAGI